MNLLLGFISFLGSVAGGDGWFPVEKVETPSVEEKVEEESHPIYVQKLGHERFQIQLPAEPMYQYLSESEVEISVHQGEEVFLLRVLERPDGDILAQKVKEITSEPGIVIVAIEQNAEDLVDLHYFVQGKWVKERLLLTEEHLYLLQTQSVQPLTAAHEECISSLAIK